MKRCALVLAAALALLWGREVWQGRSMARVDLFCDDALLREEACSGPVAQLENADYSQVMVNYPYEWWNGHELRHGRLPAWNPRVGMGAPTRVTFQGAWLNPMRLPFYVHASVRMHDLSMLLQLFVAGLFAFALARELGAGDDGGILAALAYTFSGFLSAYIAFSLAASAAMLPVLLFAAEKLARTGSVEAMLGCGVAFGLSATLGHPSTNFLTPQAGILWLLARRAWRHPLPALGALAIGAAIAAAAWIGFFELLRNGYTYKNETRGENQLSKLREVAQPVYQGGLVAPRALDAFRNGQDRLVPYPHHVSPYMGISTIALALWAVAARRLNLGLIVVAVWASIIIFFPGPIARLPGYDKIFFYYCTYLLALPIAVGAGLAVRALDCWWKPLLVALLGVLFVLVMRPLFREAATPKALSAWNIWRPGHVKLWDHFGALFALIVVAAALAAIAPLRRFCAPVLCVLVLGDLAWNTAITHEPAARFDLRGQNTSALRAAHAVIPFEPGQGRLTGTDWRAPTINGGSVMALPDLRQTDALQVARYTDFMKVLDSYNRSNFPTLRVTKRWGSPLVDLAGVKLIVRERLGPVEHWRWRHKIGSPPPDLPMELDGNPARPRVFMNDSVALYRNDGAKPRAFLVGRTIRVAGQTAALTHLGMTDLHGTVILEDASVDLDDVSTGSVTFRRDDPNDIELAVDAPAPRYLVLADTYYPGWRATIDGQKTPIYPADVAFRAVQVPAGQHTVKFAYRPRWRTVENWLSLPVLLFACGFLIYRLKARPKLTSRLAVN
jgi:hypothetical protein